MPERAIEAANKLSKELKAKGRRDFWRNLIETGLLIVVAFLVGAILFNVVEGRHENSQRSSQRKAQIDQLGQLVARIDDALNPKGCVAMRGQQNQAAAIAAIINEEKKDHGRPTIPVPTPSTEACPGEPGGPPLVVPESTTTTTRAVRKSPTTTRTTQVASAPTDSPTSPPTTTSTAAKTCTDPLCVL